MSTTSLALGDTATADAAMHAVLESTRALLWITSPTDAAAIARDLVVLLGGTTVAPSGDAGSAIPIDISFGSGAPVLPTAPIATTARAALERYLPAFVGDVYRALELVERSSRLVEDASVDALTGLANRRMLGRMLGRLRPGDTVIIIDLDHFKAVNDTLGHHEGDRVLSALGHSLRATVRAADHVGRYGGEEFVVVLGGTDADAFLRRLRDEWTATRPHPVTFSAGISTARADPQRALEAADRALYRAKESGRDQWQTATEGDYV